MIAMTPRAMTQMDARKKKRLGANTQFKSFSQRVEEIEIDVYRSLDPLKSEPADGSSFFRESLVYWRNIDFDDDEDDLNLDDGDDEPFYDD